MNYDELVTAAMAQHRKFRAQIRRQSGRVRPPAVAARGTGPHRTRQTRRVSPTVFVFGDGATVTAGGEIRQEIRTAVDTADLALNLALTLRYLSEIGLADDTTEIVGQQVRHLLTELARDNPRRSEITPRLQVVKKVLTPVAEGLHDAVSRESARVAADILARMAPWLAD